MTVSALLKKAREEKWEAQDLLDVLMRRVDRRFRYPPVDPVMVAQELGIACFDRAGLKARWNAIMVSMGEHGHTQPSIVVDRECTPLERRFGFAKGIGHLILHPNTRQHRTLDFTEGNGESLVANSFAARLLMPGRMLSQLAGRMKFGEMALAFDVTEKMLSQRWEGFSILGKKANS